MQLVWTEAELAYFAGILDGEGCFCLHSHKAKPSLRGHIYSCQIHVGNTDLRLLNWVQVRFGGNVFAEKLPEGTRRKPIWRWYANADEIDKWIKPILPFLVIKRDRAELLIAYRMTLPPRVDKSRSTKQTPEHIKSHRAELHGKLQQLNKRGNSQVQRGEHLEPVH